MRFRNWRSIRETAASPRRRTAWRRRAAAWLCVAATATVVFGAPPAAAPRIDVAWQAAPLVDVVAGLDRIGPQAVFLDRRVDPTQRIDLTLSGASLREAAERVAETAGARLARLDRVLYLGPDWIAQRLPTLAAVAQTQAAAAPPAAGRAWRGTRPLEWDFLAAPRDVVARAARTGGVRLAGVDRIPHDLWRDGSLAPAPLVEQLVVLLAGFDLTLQIDERGAGEIVPAAEDVAIERRFPRTSRLNRALATWNDAEQAPLASRPDGDAVVIRGRVEAIEALAEQLSEQGARRGARPTRSPRRSERIEVQARVRAQARPMDELLGELAERLNFSLRFDEAIAAAGVDLARPVTIDVEDVALNQLLEAILAGSPLQHAIEDDTIVISLAN